MAKLEQLLSAVADPELKAELEAEVATLKGRMRFGLVYERHLPETAIVGDVDGLKVGDHVRPRQEADNGHDYRVVGLDGSKATVIDVNGAGTNGDTIELPLGDLLAVKPFGEPAYLGLAPLGAVRRSETRPSHVVINGENFHALQLLTFLYEGQVDCIYIDPPYNTGARDWTYNNHYVDANDSYRHSKWLSMMEKRLRVAQRLLKDDAVLIVTVDEHEVHHLGLLLEALFPAATTQLITIVINPLGQARKQELGRVEEYAFVLFLGNASPTPVIDDLLNGADTPQTAKPRWERLVRGGTDATRVASPNLFYPVFINPETKEILSVGDPLPRDASREDIEVPDGQVAVWPLRTSGEEGRWRLAAATLRDYVEQGTARVGTYDKANDRWTLLYLGRAMLRRIEEGDVRIVGRDPVTAAVEIEYVNASVTVAKTVWNRGRHRAGEYGSRVLTTFLGERRFNYPKSIYAVLDTLRIATGSNKQALVVDFFAGSGTTLHSTLLLNAEDGGNRRCVLVTNNEVGPDETRKLNRSGYYRGQPEFEKHGVFEAVARPRVEAAIKGRRPDGAPVEGHYLDGRGYADGFDENVAFFRLDYLDPDQLELGRCFDSIHSLLWLKSGSRGQIPPVEKHARYLLAPECGYAVLFDEDASREFEEALAARLGIDYAFLVTDSDEAYAEMRERLGSGVETNMLYGDLLRHFRRRRA